MNKYSYLLYKPSFRQNFGDEKLHQIRLGLVHGLTEEQIKLYADPKFNYTQMKEIRQALENNLTIEQVQLYADPKFDCDQIENNGKHVIDSKVFYCDAQRSDQKSQIELSHEYIRRFIPKGVSINNYTEKDIQNMMNHINSTPRKSLNWKSPYEVSIEMFGEEFLKKLNILKIESKEIILNSKLFKKY